MKIALAQFNSTVGAIEENCRRILDIYHQQVASGADLVVFPELAVSGYPPRDLLDREDFLARCVNAADFLVSQTTTAGLLFGGPIPNPEPLGKVAFNVAILAEEGVEVGRQAKTLLPTYDVFDERRYFAPAPQRRPIEWRGLRWGLTICEDIWTLEYSNQRERPYGVNPLAVLKRSGIDILACISASPFSRNKPHQRHAIIRSTTADLGVPVVYCNAVGGNDSIIFDGSSFVLGSKGELLAAAEEFRESVVYYDTESPELVEAPWSESEIEGIHDALILGLSDYVKKCGFSEVVIGLSGGIDSALTAALAAEALGPGRVHCVSMPSRFTQERSKSDARKFAENLGIDFREITIEPAFETMLEMLSHEFVGLERDVTEENLQARIRGTILMALSNKFGWLVLSTGNKSEVAVGYSTLYGDTCGGLAVIADVPKTDVYRLARFVNERAEREVILPSIVEKAPSAELKDNQKDQDFLPPYELLDSILEAYVEKNLSFAEIVQLTEGDRALVERVIRMIDGSEYKRQQLPPALRVTSKAFGYGRRMPIAQHFSIIASEALSGERPAAEEARG